MNPRLSESKNVRHALINSNLIMKWFDSKYQIHVLVWKSQDKELMSNCHENKIKKTCKLM